jgi:ABC-type Fe3+ transport system substrate-binding protein
LRALQDFRGHGVGKNIRTHLLPELDYQAFGSLVRLINRAPHPSATKVLIDWRLTREAQAAWAKDLARQLIR